MSANVPAGGIAKFTELFQASSAVPITVHPLTLLNMTDEAARVETINHKQQQQEGGGGKMRAPFGVLLGTSGKETSVHTSADFIVTYDSKTGKYDADWAQAAKRVELIRTVLPTYDVVGFYTTGAGINVDLATTITAEFVREKPKLEQSNVCPRPVMLLLDTKPPEGFRGVPLAAFEIGVVAAGKSQQQQDDSSSASSAAPTTTLTRVEFRFESEETERISVQQSADSAGVGRGNWVGPAAGRFAGAVSSLERRVEVIASYLTAVSKGKIAPDAELLRRIKQCATKLPRPEDAVELRQLLGEGVEDAVATTIVSLMTKGALGFAQLSEDTQLSLEAEQRMYNRGH